MAIATSSNPSAREDLAVGHDVVGRIEHVMAGFGAGGGRLGMRHMRAAADDFCAGGVLQGTGGRRMVAMGMGDHDEIDGFTAHRREEGGDVGIVVGARIEDGDVTVADDVAAGAGEGERPGIGGDHPAHERREPAQFAGRRRRRPVEGNVVVGRVGHALSPSGRA